MDVFALLIDGLFFIDIIVNFRTTYMNSITGDEIWSPSMIAKHYIRSIGFWIDFISFIPFDYFKGDHGYAG